MREITTTYRITLDGQTTEYTETREAESVRDAHYQIMWAWYGVEKIEFIADVQ